MAGHDAALKNGGTDVQENTVCPCYQWLICDMVTPTRLSFEHVAYHSLTRMTGELSGDINWYVGFVFPYNYISVYVPMVTKRYDFVTLRQTFEIMSTILEKEIQRI